MLDVTEAAKAIGFNLSTVVTDHLFHGYVEVPTGLDGSFGQSVTGRLHEAMIHPEQAVSIDVITEESERIQKCLPCAYRQRSLDPYDSSDSYVCAVDSSPISSHRQDSDNCIDFEEAAQPLENDEYI